MPMCVVCLMCAKLRICIDVLRCMLDLMRYRRRQREVRGWKKREGLFGCSFALRNLGFISKLHSEFTPFPIPKILQLALFCFLIGTINSKSTLGSSLSVQNSVINSRYHAVLQISTTYSSGITETLYSLKSKTSPPPSPQQPTIYSLLL